MSVIIAKNSSLKLPATVALPMIFVSEVACACTLCHSELAAQVRALFLLGNPFANLAMLVVPLLVIGVIAWCTHGPGPR
jgi:hypothetical protein